MRQYVASKFTKEFFYTNYTYMTTTEEAVKQLEMVSGIKPSNKTLEQRVSDLEYINRKKIQALKFRNELTAFMSALNQAKYYNILENKPNELDLMLGTLSNNLYNVFN
jgi:hypothetical protein